MADQHDLLARLFETPGRQHVNIKFFPGSSDEVAPQELADAVASAINAVDTGQATRIHSLDD